MGLIDTEIGMDRFTVRRLDIVHDASIPEYRTDIDTIKYVGIYKSIVCGALANGKIHLLFTATVSLVRTA